MFNLKFYIMSILGALAGGAVSGLFGLAGQAQQASYTKEQQRLQSKLNREEMAYSQGLQNAQQEHLMNTMYGKMVSGMKNAGLNPATANGTTPATPSVGHPSSGGVGPAGPPTSSLGSDIVSGAIAGANVQKDLAIKDAQKENIDADTQLKQSQSRNTEADTKLKEWESDPRILKLKEQGLDATAQRTYAEAGVAKQEMIRIGRDADLIFEKIGLTQQEKQRCQAETAKTYTAIMTDLQQLTESEQRIALLIAEEDLAKEQKRTERSKQAELGAAADSHKANAAYARAGVVTRHQEARESKARTVGLQIANRANEWRQKVTEASGSVTEQGALLGAKRIIGLFNPFDHVSFGGSTVTHN